MKKTYLQPSVKVVVITTTSFIAYSGDTLTEGITDTVIGGDKAWSRHQSHFNVRGDDDD